MSSSTKYGSGILKAKSGVPRDQPSLAASTHCRGAGAAATSPAGAPASTQRTRVSISVSLRPRSFEKTPLGADANQGGISRASTLCAMARAQGRVSS